MKIKHLAARIEGCRKDLLSSKKLSFNSPITLLALLQGCDPAKLQDKKLLILALLSSIFEGDMRLYKFFSHQFEGGGHGITLGAIIGSSHIVVSTYPELGCLSLSINTCTGYPLNSLYVFINIFKPKKYELTILPPFATIAKIDSRIILKEKDITDEKLKKWCKERGLLPLYNSSDKTLLLLNILGFVFGDGHLRKDLTSVHIWQKDKNILEIIGKRLEDLNVKFTIKPRKSQSRHNVFELTSCDSNFCKLLYLLGAPKGSKTQQPIKVPSWLNYQPTPLKAVFLSSLFLSEFCKPKIYAEKSASPLYCRFGMVTSLQYERELVNFLKDIVALCEELHIKSNLIKVAERYKCRNKKMVKYYIHFSATKQNFLRIYSLISISKIYPLSLFDFNFNLKVQRPIYPKNSRYKEIIEYLMKNENVTTKEIISAIGMSKQNATKWLKRLEERGIVINNRETYKKRGPNKWKLNV